MRFFDLPLNQLKLRQKIFQFQLVTDIIGHSRRRLMCVELLNKKQSRQASLIVRD